jgi:histidine phosphotransfer protein HptB
MVWVVPEELRQLAECCDTGLVEDLLFTFRTDTAQRLCVMRFALNSGERSPLKSEAHAVKGSAGQIGAPLLASMCHQMEAMALDAPVSELATLMAAIESAFVEVCGQMPQ